MSEEEAWGQLVSLTDIESDPIPLKSDKFTVGRALDCDLCLSENKLVSGHHCYIQRDPSGKVLLYDSSTNGTLLNLTYKITKGKHKELEHGDEFYVVYKKNNEDLNVGYIYQDTALLREEEGTQEYSPPELLDATLEDSGVNDVSPEKSGEKRKSEDESADEVPLKKQKTETRSAKDVMKTEQGGKTTSSSQSLAEGGEEKISSHGNEKTSEDESKVKETEGGESKSKEVESKDIESKEKKSELESKEKAGHSKVDSKADEKDDIEENLQCMICQEIMHDCISLQPCLHSFCAGCYSDWMSRSNECPSCRLKVQRINKNHIVNNLIEAYLKEHPGKRRPEEDIKELDEKNKITKDMLYPKRKQRYSGSSDYSDTSEDDDDSSTATTGTLFPPPVPPAPIAAPAPTLFGFGTPIFGIHRPPKTVCRQCPEYKDPMDGSGIVGGIKTAIQTVKNLVTGTGGKTPEKKEEETPGTSEGEKSEPEPSTSGEAGPSTSGEATKLPYKDDPKEMPDPPVYQCGPLQNHVLCQCCLQPMPDLRTQYNINPDQNRPQQCRLCYRAYCHAYWGCRKADCLGCLNKLKDMNFGRKALMGLILNNQHESEIFKNYIDAHGMSVKDVLQECCRRLDAGLFTITAQMTHTANSNTPVCYACGLNIFRELAFQYRKTLKKEDFPEKVRNRPDCYWGHKCRTQRNKPHHAVNFNHICEQTRFT